MHHPEHNERVAVHWNETMRSGELWEDTFPLKGKDGSYRWFLSRAFPIRDHAGKIIRWFGTNTDITDLLEAKQLADTMGDELANKNLELERRVDERTAKLRDTIGELEHFSYTITHDMRAPLRAMEAFGQILREEYHATLDEADRDYLRRIVDSANRMDSLITDALTYSKVVQDEFPLELLDPGALLRGIVDSYPQFQPPQAEIRLEGSFPLVAGFSNLLGNAVKFVEPGKLPQVRVWAEEQGVCVWLSFEDNGIGIEPDQQKRVFIMFQRVSKPYEGTGIS